MVSWRRIQHALQAKHACEPSSPWLQVCLLIFWCSSVCFCRVSVAGELLSGFVRGAILMLRHVPAPAFIPAPHRYLSTLHLDIQGMISMSLDRNFWISLGGSRDRSRRPRKQTERCFGTNREDEREDLVGNPFQRERRRKTRQRGVRNLVLHEQLHQVRHRNSVRVQLPGTKTSSSTRSGRPRSLGLILNEVYVQGQLAVARGRVRNQNVLPLGHQSAKSK